MQTCGDKTKGLARKGDFSFSYPLRQRLKATRLNLLVKDGECSRRDPKIQILTEVETRLPPAESFSKKAFFLQIKMSECKPTY